MTILSFEELMQICKQNNQKIFEVAQLEEAKLAEVDVDLIRAKTLETLNAMRDAIKNGLKSTEKSVSDWCGDDAVKLVERYKNRPALLGTIFEKITTYAIATAEENLRMGRIVACPTAGSCGILPSVLISVAEELNVSESKLVDALLTAGVV